VSPATLDGLFEQLADLIADRIAVRLNGRAPAVGEEPECLLDVRAAAQVLGVTPGWLRRHGPALPFTRKLSHRVVRYSSTGIAAWLRRAGSGVLRGTGSARPASTIRGRGPRRDPKGAGR